jgi:long-chain acyl-CoA synthetase
MSHRLLLKELSRYKIGTFADIIYRNALLYADKDAFIFGKKRTTFSEYNARVNKVVRALQGMGVKKGDVIGILSWNCLEYADLYGAAMKGGFIASPFSPRLKADELNYIINYSEANTLFVGPELLGMAKSLKANLPKVKNYISLESTDPEMKAYDDLLAANSGEEPDVQISEDDPVTLIYTSGTTGVPRGALHNHRGMIDDSRTLIIDTGIRSTDKHIQLTPLFHIGGYTFFRAFLYIGATNVILRNFDPAATLRTIQTEKVTHINLVPTHIIAMLALPDIDKYKLGSLKVMWYGGSPIPVKVLKKAIQTFGPILSQGYGQSESGPAMTHLSIEEHDVLNKPEAEQKKLFSAGRPDVGIHVRIVDEVGQDVESGESGEIIVSSKHNMVEYWRKPEDTKANLADGWLHTGDIGYYDEQGYVYITDRKKDMIKSGGEDVFPREVEELLYKHSAVAEAQVFGVPDPYWIERVHAVVMVKEGAKCTAEELIAFCKERIAGYKVPKSLEFVTEFPKTASGRIIKRNIREKYWAGLPRRV